jgi:hypothetical protein
LTSAKDSPEGQAGENAELQKILRIARENEAQLRRVLDAALEAEGARLACTAILGAFGVLVKDRIDAAALEMAQTGMSALVTKFQGPRDAVRRWHAQRDGFDPEKQGIVIFDLVQEVSRTAHLFQLPAMPFGVDAIKEFRRGYLKEHFGKRFPSTADLTKWFTKLGQAKVKGGLTPVGIAARILCQGRHLGARNLEATVMRVTQVLRSVSQRSASGSKPKKVRKELK